MPRFSAPITTFAGLAIVGDHRHRLRRNRSAAAPRPRPAAAAAFRSADNRPP